MTFEERVQALAPLGLTMRQTRFLVTVALHGGYCLRRQYATFAGVRYGKNVRQFLDGLVALRLASRTRFRADRGHVYYLHHRSVYRALDVDTPRKRTPASPALIARKLMLLDVVLGEPAATWYATEQEKVSLFSQAFHVPEPDLPKRVYEAEHAVDGQTTRYFAHNLPIFVRDGDPAVHFVYLAVDVTARGLEQFLIDHAALMHHLPRWVVVCVRPAHLGPLPGAQVSFEHFVSPVAKATNGNASLARYFMTRRAIEQDQLAGLSVAELYQFRAAKRRFSSPAVEQQYRVWLSGGGQVSAAHDEQQPSGGTGSLVMRALPFPYQQFGTLAGVA